MSEKKYLHIVNDKIVSGDLDGAKRLLENAIRTNPEFFLYNERLADIFRKSGDAEGAIKHYNYAIRKNPSASWITKKLDMVEAEKNPRQERSNICGTYDFCPDCTGKRKAEGGLRTKGVWKESLINKPLVTIVTAIYDNSDTFQRCIDSVKNQVYSNIEYIVIDGGSPEGTIDVIRENEGDIDYYVSEPDRGIYSAMNKGISLARGDYICLLNSDDYYEPDFVEQAVRLVAEDGYKADIVYTDYHVGTNHLVAQHIDEGLLFGHLHVCHNTFLVSRACYDSIGPYNEDFRIVSDAVWMRKAYTERARFLCLNEPLFTLTEGGLSSGNTEARRQLFIAEVVESYRMTFPQLSEEDAEQIYLFRFNKERTRTLNEIASRYSDHPGILRALRGYVEHCFRDRANFLLGVNEASTLFPEFIALADRLGLDKRCIRIETKHGLLSEVLKRLDETLKLRKPSSTKTILHFVSVFSSPPETFIYDLLNRLEEDTNYDNFVLFEHALLREERPYEKAIQIHWPDFREEVAVQIYKYIVDQLKADVVIGHFALNEWKWAQRIKSLSLSIPTISMTHGIDAFAMRDNQAYRTYIVEDFCKRPNTAFTAVSDYLKKELLSHGVPEQKVTLLHNTVNPLFFAHRKSQGFYDGKRQLRILAVGRLIQWKGHEYLIRALRSFKETCTKNVHLTIVYGNGAERLDELTAQVNELKLTDNVTFESFVNFQEQPDYFAQFDLYIHPSTYSNDKFEQSETFGVAVLEAIAAGLPVISSDAGGLPEVIGEEKTFARVVPHANVEALSSAMGEMWRSRAAFRDNRAYALERLERFSPRAQITQLSKLIDNLTATSIKAAIFSTSTIQGAGYAAYRLHRGLMDANVVPHVFTTVRSHEGEPDVTVLRHPSGDDRNWAALQVPQKPGLTIFTLNQTHIPSKDLVKLVEDYDVINLHWHARFLSIENIASLTRLGKPVVMTIRDKLPITGGCHVFHGCESWQRGCKECPQIPSKYTDFPSKVMEEKYEYYDFSNLTIVTLSNHTRDIIKKAPYFNRCRMETIPNSIETDVFRPYDKIEARREFGLPLDRKIIAYVPSFSSEVKGYREILEAFRLLAPAKLGTDPFVMLVGNETPATKEISLDKKALGYIADNDKLARVYSAADLVVVPSLEETFSNTTAEAISCGVPVVGFKTGAIPDLAVDGKTGYTYPVGDAKGLAEGIRRVLTGPDMGSACRAHAEDMLTFMIQARRYEALFRELVSQTSNRISTDAIPPVFNCFGESGADFINIASEMVLKTKK